MRPRKPLHLAAGALAFGLQLLAQTAVAHIELQLPMNRYSDVRRGANEACPCGSGTTSRRCNAPADFSDGARSLDRITTFAPGDTITVRFSEYVGHEGRYRIAFDPDGAELGDFNQHILLDEPDPRGAAGNIGEGTIWELQVRLPDMTCDNCTLQLIQVIDGNTTERVFDPSTRGETYFQCADIVLAEGTPPGGIPPVNPGEHLAELSRPQRAPAAAAPDDAPDPDEPGDNALAMAAAGGASGTSVTPAARDGSVMMTPPEGSESGCSLAARPPRHGSLPALALLAATIAALLGRQRPR